MGSDQKISPSEFIGLSKFRGSDLIEKGSKWYRMGDRFTIGRVSDSGRGGIEEDRIRNRRVSVSNKRGIGRGSDFYQFRYLSDPKITCQFIEGVLT